MKYRHYTQEEVRFLRDSAQELTAKEIAVILKRSESSIFNKCMKLGISLKKRGVNEGRLHQQAA